MNRTRSTMLLTAAVLVAGCSTLPDADKQAPLEVSARAKVERDEFQKLTRLRGQTVRLGLGFDWWFTAVKNDAEPAPTYFICFRSIRSSQEGWAFWERAYDLDGNQLPVTKLSSDVMTAGVTREVVAASVTREWLEAKSSTGIKVRLDGQRAKQVVEVYQPQVAGFLEAVKAQGW